MRTRMFGFDLVATLALIGMVTGEVLASAPATPLTAPKTVEYKPDAKIEELSTAQQIAEIDRLLGMKLKANTLRNQVRLSARKPWIGKKALVDLDEADDVSTRHDQVSFEKYGLVRIGIRSSPGFSYLVECGVGKAAKVDINVHSYDASANPDDEDWWAFTPDTRKELMGATQDVVNRKVTFSFGPTGVQNIGIELRHTNGGPFVWHYCKITPVKP